MSLQRNITFSALQDSFKADHPCPSDRQRLVKTGNNVKSDTGVFRKAAQSLVRPWALILGGRLYGRLCAQILVLRFQLNTICTCSLTRYVQRYPEFEN